MQLNFQVKKCFEVSQQKKMCPSLKFMETVFNTQPAIKMYQFMQNIFSTRPALRKHKAKVHPQFNKFKYD